MSEFRQSMTNGEWVVISGDRGKRPHDYQSTSSDIRDNLAKHDKKCPFCPGGKAKHDPELFRIGDEKFWQLRVLENKYAALKHNILPHRKRHGIFNKATGYGVAEVVVESPNHNDCIPLMKLEEVENIINAYKIRYNRLLEDSNINIICIFKNHGPLAGASLIHPHSQIIGSMVTPPNISEQIFFSRRSFDDHGKCVYCRLIHEELKQRERIIMDSEHFLAYCPFASRSPYEVRIIPKRHSAVFGSISDKEVSDFALVLQTVIRKLYYLLDDPDYNYVFRSITTNDCEVQFYHWHMIIMPRIVKQAGFEIGTGIYINPIPPENCVEDLNSVKIK